MLCFYCAYTYNYTLRKIHFLTQKSANEKPLNGGFVITVQKGFELLVFNLQTNLQNCILFIHRMNNYCIPMNYFTAIYCGATPDGVS